MGNTPPAQQAAHCNNIKCAARVQRSCQTTPTRSCAHSAEIQPICSNGCIQAVKLPESADLCHTCRREVDILRRLKGTLNVAHIVNAYEDDECVYIVLEYCSGGELWDRIGKLHYSERTVSPG